MTLAELVAKAYVTATGKLSTLTAADTKYQKLVAIANNQIDLWQNTPNVDWNSLYDKTYSLGTVTATDTFTLGDDVRKISDALGDYVQIKTADGNTTNFDVVSADSLKRYVNGSRVCAQIGRSLVFPQAFTASDPLYGGTIYAPIYRYAEPLVNASDDVPVDIAQWLVLMTAAEYVRNDNTKLNQYPNLVRQANDLLTRMIDDNDGQMTEAYMSWSAATRSW